MSELLTAVEIVFYPEYRNYWLRFGWPMRRSNWTGAGG